MSTVIAFPSAADRGRLAVDRALAAFDIESGAGIEEMMRLALEHAEPEVRDRASRWLAEVLNVRVAQQPGRLASTRQPEMTGGFHPCFPYSFHAAQLERC